jgi:hypothetical protein
MHRFSGRVFALALVLAFPGFLRAAEPSEITGRWNLTFTEPWQFPGWLGMQKEGDTWEGGIVAGGGGVREITEFTIDENGAFDFKTPHRRYKGQVDGDKITGQAVDNRDRTYQWHGTRFIPAIDVSGKWHLRLDDEKSTILHLVFQQDDADISGVVDQKWEGTKRISMAQPIELKNLKLDRQAGTLTFVIENRTVTAKVEGDELDGQITAPETRFTGYRQREWGEPIELFNGKDLDNWKPLGDPNRFYWKVEDGLMVNTQDHGANIVTKRDDFRDFKIIVEFKVPEDGNSGVYLRGRHEIQVGDSYGKEPNAGSCGAIYARIVPSSNQCKKPGEWQRYDAKIIGHYVTVIHNGKRIIDNQEIRGIAGGALDSNENGPGPIYLQGDHSTVTYRRITVIPALPTEP